MGRLGDIADIATLALLGAGGYLLYRAWKGVEADVEAIVDVIPGLPPVIPTIPGLVKLPGTVIDVPDIPAIVEVIDRVRRYRVPDEPEPRPYKQPWIPPAEIETISPPTQLPVQLVTPWVPTLERDPWEMRERRLEPEIRRYLETASTVEAALQVSRDIEKLVVPQYDPRYDVYAERRLI